MSDVLKVKTVATAGPRAKTRLVRFSVPEGARPRAFVPAGLMLGSYPKPDDARYFVGTLARKHALEDLDPNGFALLNWGVMRSLYSRDHLKATIDQLAANGVIEVDRHYVPGKKSRGYRLTPEWLRRHAIPRELTDRALLCRLAREKEKWQRRQDSRRRPIHDQLEAWNELITLKPDVWARLDELPPETRLGQSVLVQRIHARDYHFSVSEYGRVFNPITGLERSLRQHMLIDNQGVGGLDISCAQPALLGLLLARRQAYPASLSRIHNPCLAGECYLCSLPALPLPSVLPLVSRRELCSFLDLVECGGLYSELLRLMRMNESPELLARVKRRFLVDVLAKGRDYPSEVERAFRRQFPTLCEFIDAVNRDDHGTLIRALQRLEAWLVIDNIATRVNVPIVTLHDCVYFRRRDEDCVRPAFVEAFAATGLRARYKPC